MSGKVWFSDVMANYLIGYEQGLRAKFRGEDWEAAQHHCKFCEARVGRALLNPPSRLS